jgi:hypothetical protein
MDSTRVTWPLFFLRLLQQPLNNRFHANPITRTFGFADHGGYQMGSTVWPAVRTFALTHFHTGSDGKTITAQRLDSGINSDLNPRLIAISCIGLQSSPCAPFPGTFAAGHVHSVLRGKAKLSQG